MYLAVASVRFIDLFLVLGKNEFAVEFLRRGCQALRYISLNT
jgi:hypothetical protein